MGRAGLQDDVMAASTHAAFIADWDHEADEKRIVPPSRPTELFGQGDRFSQYGRKLVEQVEHILHAIGSDRKIKLIICDLDDTLWRGIAAEDDITPIFRAEGWPFGLVEALLVFKKRGGLLAICSKNAQAETLERFKTIWREVLTIDDFASVRINWDAKSGNVAQILEETNILPRNTLFLDDNPREVDEVRQAFPEMNFLGFDHYLWRGEILNRPDMLVPFVTPEAAAKTTLVKAKIERDRSMAVSDRGAWLASLGLTLAFALIASIQDPEFPRALELINKTNQFNTNGRRWTAEQLSDLFAGGGYLVASHLSDIHADNGLVGVVIVDGDVLVQVVLSCRVFNLGAEAGMVHAAVKLILADHDMALGSIVPTGANFVCHELYSSLGFERLGDSFSTRALPRWPAWIADVSDAGFSQGGRPTLGSAVRRWVRRVRNA
jgi:FkbH-like protein